MPSKRTSPEAKQRQGPSSPVNSPRQRSKSTTAHHLFESSAPAALMEELRNARGYSSTPLMYPHDDPTNRFKVYFSKFITVFIYYCVALPFTIVKIVTSYYTERRYRRRQIKRFENSLKFTEDGATWYRSARELDRLRGYEEWCLEEDIVSTSQQRRGGVVSPGAQGASSSSSGGGRGVISPTTPGSPQPLSPNRSSDSKFKIFEPRTWLRVLKSAGHSATKQAVRIDAIALVEETKAIRAITASGNQTAMGEYLRTHLLRDALGMGAEELYIYYTGTKCFVEEYLDAVREMIQQFSMEPGTRAMPTGEARDNSTPVAFGSSTTSDPPGGLMAPEHTSGYTQAMLDFAIKNRKPGSNGFDLPAAKRLPVLQAASQSMGRTALMLSGGAGLGMYHIGVVKALHEVNLLPKIISGSSAGAIVGAFVCCKKDDALESVLMDGMQDTCFDAFEEIEQAELNVMIKMKRLLGSGGFMDVTQLVICMRKNCGDLTFLEAYQATGRIFNVSIMADREGDKATLLNYVTAPNVLVWSGVVASCCMPGLYKKFQLSQKVPQTNEIIPYMPEQLWFDGSVANDLPRRQLTEMFHCSFFIVSQVNPHVIPFVKSNTPHIHKKRTGWFKTLWFSTCAEVGHWCHKYTDLLQHHPALSGQASEFLHNLMKQEYTGDVTIFPIGSVWDAIPDFVNITTNPTPEHMSFVSGKGMRRALPSIHKIRCMTEIERVLEQEVDRLTKQVKINHRADQLRKERSQEQK